MMASLLSRAGQCTVTVRYDNASVNDRTLFAESLQAGLDEVLAMAGPSAGRSTPASFCGRLTQGDAKRPTQPIRPRGENEQNMFSAVLIFLLVLSPVLIPAIITALHALASIWRNHRQIPSTPRAVIRRLARRQHVTHQRVATGNKYPEQRAETAA